MCPGRAPLGGGLEPGVCATATGLGRGLDGCEPEDLGLDSHRLEGLGRAPPVESRRTRRVVPHCGWSGSRRGPRTAVWAGGLDSRPRIEGGRRRGRSMAPTAPSATSRAGTRAKDWAGPEARSASRNATCSPEQGPGFRRPAGMARGLSRRSTCAGWRARASGLRQARHALPSRGLRCRRDAAGLALAAGLEGGGVHDSSAGRAC